MPKAKVGDDLPLLASQANVAFTYNGVDFNFDDNRLVNLTAMWKVAGADQSKQPKQWRRKEGASFISHRASVEKVPHSHLFRTTKGRNGETWAHWQIALAYAKYLSNEFHSVVNAAFKEWAEEKADPGLKYERAVDGYLKQGHTEEWINRRFKGITARKALCSTMADHNCKVRGSNNPFAEITRVITLNVLGKTPREIREDKGLVKSAATRDHIDEEQLISIEWAEIQSRKLIKAEAADGGDACVDAGRRASKAIREALTSLAPPARQFDRA